MPFWKVPSGEVTNLPYLLALAKTGKPVVMSTGMCNMEEIREAIHVLKTNGIKEIKLLHCNTEYPTPFEDVNCKESHINIVNCENPLEECLYVASDIAKRLDDNR